MSVPASTLDGDFQRRVSHFVHRRFKYLLIWPAVLVLLLIGVFPLINVLVVSFQDVSLIVEDTSFHGLLNYGRIFDDVRLWEAIWHTVAFTAVALPLELALGMAMALLFVEHMRGRAIFVALLIIPTVISPIVAGTMWRLMFDVQFGPINQILGWLAGHPVTITWTVDSTFVWPAILLTEIWQWTPFMFLLLLAALSNVDKSQLEAAQIDGASNLRIFHKIVLPSIWPVMAIALLIRALEVSVGPADGASMPRIGLGVPAGMTAATPELRAAGVQFLVCAFDARRDDIAVLRQHRNLAESVGAVVSLELVLPALGDYGEEAKAAARLVAEAGVDVADVAVSPAPYLMSYQPTAEWPDIPPLEECYDAVRTAFPGKPVGGGMFAYFTELNRKRPPAVKLDFVTHTTCPIVHDADDRAVMESLEALPDVIASMRAIVGPVPYRIGPSAIGMRHNPYGAAPVENPDNVRVAMARVDPRQRGLFGAAWNLGYAAEAARGGLEALALSAPVGPFGIVYRRADHAQPYYDDLTGPAVYPVYYVIAAMAAAAGKPRLAARNSDRLRVQSVAWAGPDGPVLWVANVTDRPQVVVLAGLEDHTVVVRTLDAATYGQATADRAAFLAGGELRTSAGELTLDAYALAAVEARG